MAGAVEPGGRTLVVDTGYFGHRFTAINEVYGASVEELSFPLGKHCDPAEVRKRLSTGKFNTIFVTRVDTGH